MKSFDIPLPKTWPTNLKSAVLHTLSLAHFIMTYTRSWCANSSISRLRIKAQQEVTLLKEEIRRSNGKNLCSSTTSLLPY